MSSKIIRREDLDPNGAPESRADAMLWRERGRAAQTSTANGPAHRAPAVAQSLDAAAAEQIRAAAYQQGVAAGDAAATQRAQAKLDPVLASFNAIIADLAKTRKSLRAEAESAAVALALQVARRVLHREISADPEAILGLVKAAFDKCDARATQRLRVSPEDAEAIRDHRARLNFPEGLEITPDRNLARGSAIFETSQGDLDASVGTQLDEIQRGLADVVKRRNS